MKVNTRPEQEVPAAMLQLLPELRFERWLVEWLHWCGQANWVLPEDILLKLLRLTDDCLNDYGNDPQELAFIPALRPLLGTRGEQLLTKHPQWRPAFAAAPELKAYWRQQSQPYQRQLALLILLGQRGPQEVKTLLLEEFSDQGVRGQELLILGLLSLNLPDAESALEALLHHSLGVRGQAVKEGIRMQLQRWPSSAYNQQLLSWLTQQRDTGQLVPLSAQEQRRYGLPDAQTPQEQFSALVEAIHPEVLLLSWPLSAGALIALAEAQHALDGLARSIYVCRHTELAERLWHHSHKLPSRQGLKLKELLCAVWSGPEREPFLLELLSQSDLYPLFNLLYDHQSPWSLEFSTVVLQTLRQRLWPVHPYLCSWWEWAEMVAVRLNPQVSFEPQWAQHVPAEAQRAYAHLGRILDQRQQMYALLATLELPGTRGISR